MWVYNVFYNGWFEYNSNEIQKIFKRDLNEIKTKFKRNSKEIQTIGDDAIMWRNIKMWFLCSNRRLPKTVKVLERPKYFYPSNDFLRYNYSKTLKCDLIFSIRYRNVWLVELCCYVKW